MMKSKNGNPSRRATSPIDFSWTAWKRIVGRIRTGFGSDRVTFTAASVTFYAILAVVPFLATVVGVFGLFTSPERAVVIADQLKGAVPPEAISLIRQQLVELSSQKTSAGLGSLIAIVLSLWGGSKALESMMIALNVSYNEEEERSFLKRKIIGIGLTAGTALVTIVATAFLIWAGNNRGELSILVTLLKWPLIFAGIALWLSVIYRYAPDRRDAKWRWISHGALTATTLWIGASFLFSLYASNFGKYNETYGSLGAVILLLMWLYLSAISIIIGAQVNAEMELETSRDTTKGEPQPIGERGAYVSDHVAETS